MQKCTEVQKYSFKINYLQENIHHQVEMRHQLRLISSVGLKELSLTREMGSHYNRLEGRDVDQYLNGPMWFERI